MPMQHNQHIAELGSLLDSRGIRHVVIAPGSRNAPLIQLFTASPVFSCYSIVDERSAGYVSLGMARHLREPVVVVTTSGTAVLNLSPAVAEAYYQKVPLVVLTADRPPERIAQFNNQIIDQEAPFFNHSRGFFQFPFEPRSETELQQAMDAVGQLIDVAAGNPAGPVHVNIPLLEPLYEKLPAPLMKATSPSDPSAAMEEILNPGLEISGKRILLLAGMEHYNKEMASLLTQLSGTFELVVVAENISNLAYDLFIGSPELILGGASESEQRELTPELVISMGGQVVSKRLKLFLQSQADVKYLEIRADPQLQLKMIFGLGMGETESIQNRYLERWKQIESRETAWAARFIKDAPFCNLTVVHKILNEIPGPAVIHLGNSATIRYSQLMPGRPDLTYFANRGTSGIDGSVSAAVGAAMVSDELHLLLVGDLSFVYDSNALWNKHFPANLKIVVLNDGGGGIFRLLDGPDRMDFFEEFSVTHHPVSLELLSQSYGRGFQRASTLEEVVHYSRTLFDPKSNLSILEVDTTKSENSRIFKQFFNRNQ